MEMALGRYDLQEVTDEEMTEIDGGVVVTFAMVATGVGIFSAGFGIGLAIGKLF